MDERVSKKVVIDPGHGGSDPGASANGIVEKDYTLKISNYMKNRFDELGVPAELTRSTDETLDSNARPDKVQSFYGNGNDVVVVSNHINSGGGDGAEVIYALRNSSGLSSKIASGLESVGQNVRKYYQRRLPSNPAKDYYYILRDTPNNETVIVEYGFADSTGDDVSQIKKNWEELAESVVKTITEYVEGTYRPQDGTNYYVVKSGDTLWGIARKFNISVNELKTANNLSSNTLSIGQYLTIPTKQEESSSNDYYIVKSGDTLWSIARNNNISVDELKRINNLTSNTLSIGQRLLLKDNDNSFATNTYTVVSGDSLYKIANKFNTTVNEIKTINNLNSNLLSIGQVLKIPDNTSYDTYTVVSGDSLYKIANKFNTTVNELKTINNLTSNLLSIGQVLKIPN